MNAQQLSTFSQRSTWLLIAVVLCGCGTPTSGSKTDGGVTTSDGSVALLGEGQACLQGSECTSGYCTDSVCCEVACDGVCLACNDLWTKAGDGVCAAVTVNTDPDGECLAQAAESCGANGTGCNGDSAAPACHVYGPTTECAPVACVEGIRSESRLCDGAGTCVAGAGATCLPYACDAEGEACLTTCVTSVDCALDAYCNGEGQCVEKLSAGDCTEASECMSGVCSGGVCCDTACAGECEACSASDGVCELLAGAPSVCSTGLCDGASGECSATCLSQTIVPVTAPVDVIIVVDNSGSMSQEILALEENINLHFAEVMSAANIDYRIIVVSKHGSGGLDVCVKPPLSSTSNCSEEPVNVPEQFYQYSVPVASHNALCILLDSFYGDYPDQFNLAPSGWSLWVRPEAHKVFIVLGDDGAACTWNGTYFSDLNNETGGQTVASDFDQALLALSPLHFGTPSDRNYSWYSIIGMEPKDPAMPLQPWLPTDPVTTNLCTPASVDPGTAYQWLSKGTDALRWPLCHVSGYDVILQGIVEDIPKQASAPCRFAVPAPSLGQTIDVDSVLLEWTPSASPPSTFSQVTDLASCAPDAFYIEGNNIELCPATCADTTADPSATLDIHYFCN